MLEDLRESHDVRLAIRWASDRLTGLHDIYNICTRCEIFVCRSVGIGRWMINAAVK